MSSSSRHQHGFKKSKSKRSAAVGSSASSAQAAAMKLEPAQANGQQSAVTPSSFGSRSASPAVPSPSPHTGGSSPATSGSTSSFSARGASSSAPSSAVGSPVSSPTGSPGSAPFKASLSRVAKEEEDVSIVLGGDAKQRPADAPPSKYTHLDAKIWDPIIRDIAAGISEHPVDFVAPIVGHVLEEAIAATDCIPRIRNTGQGPSNVFIFYPMELFPIMKAVPRMIPQLSCNSIFHIKSTNELKQDKFYQFARKSVSTGEKKITAEMKDSQIIISICCGAANELNGARLQEIVTAFAAKDVKDIKILLFNGQACSLPEKLINNKTLFAKWKSDNKSFYTLGSDCRVTVAVEDFAGLITTPGYQEVEAGLLALLGHMTYKKSLFEATQKSCRDYIKQVGNKAQLSAEMERNRQDIQARKGRPPVPVVAMAKYEIEDKKMVPVSSFSFSSSSSAPPFLPPLHDGAQPAPQGSVVPLRIDRKAQPSASLPQRDAQPAHQHSKQAFAAATKATKQIAEAVAKATLSKLQDDKLDPAEEKHLLHQSTTWLMQIFATMEKLTLPPSSSSPPPSSDLRRKGRSLSFTGTGNFFPVPGDDKAAQHQLAATAAPARSSPTPGLALTPAAAGDG